MPNLSRRLASPGALCWDAPCGAFVPGWPGHCADQGAALTSVHGSSESLPLLWCFLVVAKVPMPLSLEKRRPSPRVEGFTASLFDHHSTKRKPGKKG